MQTHNPIKLVLAVITAMILLGGSTVFMTTGISPTIAKAQEALQEPEATQAPEAFSVEVNANNIQRGSIQTINIQTGEPAKLIGIITYPSGHKILMQGETDETGNLDYSFRVGGSSKQGTAAVTVLAVSQSGIAKGETNFEIVKKGQPIPTPTPTPEPGANVTAPSGNITEPVGNATAPITNGTIPIGNITEPVGNDTTTAPEEPIVIAPENETTTVTPDNSTDISIPVNDTSVVIPSNETTIPEPTTNDTEVIVAPENETETVTPDNATDAEIEIPEEVIDQINDTSTVVPGNVTEIAENVTVSEPLPEDVIPIENETTTGNITDIIVVPPEEQPEVIVNETGGGEPIVCVTAPCPAFPGNVTGPAPIGNETTNITEPALPVEPPIDLPPQPPVETQENATIDIINDTGTAPTPEPEPVPPANGTVQEPEPATPEEAIENVDNATEELEQAIEEGTNPEIIAAMSKAINSLEDIAQSVDTATEEEKNNAKESVENLNSLIEDAIEQAS